MFAPDDVRAIYTLARQAKAAEGHSRVLERCQGCDKPLSPARDVWGGKFGSYTQQCQRCARRNPTVRIPVFG